MNESTIVEWGGSGAGFVLHEPPGRPRPPAAFVSAADKLIKYPVVQPTADLGPHQAWSLVWTQVEEHGPHWCFAVQGRGGAFGRSGGCQFLFTPARHEPADVWLHGLTMIGPDGRLAPEPVREVPCSPPVPRDLLAPLAALTADTARVPLDGEPLEVAGSVAVLLKVLPRQVVRSRVWSTFLLKPPVLDDYNIASGHWPAELADRDSAARTRHWLGESTHLPGPRDDQDAAALRWIAEQASDQVTLGEEYRGLPDMRSFVDRVAREALVPAAHEVPRLLEEAPTRLLTPRAHPAVVRWAHDDPDRAIAHLVADRVPGELVDVVFEGLFARHEEGGNPISFPPADVSRFPRWPELLADAVRRWVPEQRDRVAFVERTLLAPGRPLADPRALAMSLLWLESLGIGADDLPPSVESIAVALGRRGRLAQRQRDYLRSTGDQVGVLRDLVGRLDFVSVAVTAELLDVAGEESTRRGLVRTVLAHNSEHADRGRGSMDTWVADLVDRRPQDQSAVVEGGFGLLREHGLLPDGLLALALSHYADRLDVSEVGRGLLLEAADRVNTAPRAPAEARTEAFPGDPYREAAHGDPGWGEGDPQGNSLHSGRRQRRAGAGDFGPSGQAGAGYGAQGFGADRYRRAEADTVAPQPLDEPVPAGNTVPVPRSRRVGREQELPPALRLALIIGIAAVVVFVLYQLFFARLG